VRQSSKRALAKRVNAVVRRVARSRRLTRGAALVRNQCEMVIACHLAPSAHSDHNGERWLVEAMSPEITRFVDVGANVGLWSALVLAHNPQAVGLAVEPGAEAIEQLRRRLPPAVRVVEAAAGDAHGVMSFFEQPGAGEASSAIETWAHGGVAREVPVVTIDALMEQERWSHLDLLKIDAEGYDARVIAGAEQTLREQRIDVLQFEYNRPWRQAGCTLGAVTLLLQTVGYTLYVLRAGGLERYDYPRFGEFFGYSNFVAVSPRCRYREALGAR